MEWILKTRMRINSSTSQRLSDMQSCLSLFLFCTEINKTWCHARRGKHGLIQALSWAGTWIPAWPPCDGAVCADPADLRDGEAQLTFISGKPKCDIEQGKPDPPPMLRSDHTLIIFLNDSILESNVKNEI